MTRRVLRPSHVGWYGLRMKNEIEKVVCNQAWRAYEGVWTLFGS